MRLAEPELASAWRRARSVPTDGFLDVARCSIPSDRVLRAGQQHLAREQQIGGYEAEEEAAEQLAQLGSGIARLLGACPGDVGLVPNGTVALQLVLLGLRLPAGSAVVVGEAEYGSNRTFVDDLAARRDWRVRPVPHAGDGLVCVEAIERELVGGAALVLLNHVASQHGNVQPVAEVAARCRWHNAVLVVDVAQSLGQVDCTALGAQVYVGTGRKWLHGPRGVGFVVAPDADEDPRLDAPRTLDSHDLAGRPLPGGLRYQTSEAAVAARVALGAAVAELHAAGPVRVFARLASLGEQARGLLAGAGGWQLVPAATPSALLTLRPPGGGDPEVTARLAASSGLRVGAVPARRAANMTGPVLRVSPWPGAESDDLVRLAEVLARA